MIFSAKCISLYTAPEGEERLMDIFNVSRQISSGVYTAQITFVPIYFSHLATLTLQWSNVTSHSGW